MLEKKVVWGGHSEFSIGHFKYGEMVFIYFLNTEYKRIPSLSWIPYLKIKKNVIKDNLTQTIWTPKYRI